MWILIPVFWLCVLAVPSFSNLYTLDGVNVIYDVTLKVVGHQWYWEYEYNVENIF